MEPRYLSTKAAAEYLGCTPNTVRSLVKDGKLPAVQIGSLKRVDRKLLDEWAERQLRAQAA